MKKEIEIKNKKITKENILKLWDKLCELQTNYPEKTKDITLNFETDDGTIYDKNDKPFETIIDCKKCKSIQIKFLSYNNYWKDKKEIILNLRRDGDNFYNFYSSKIEIEGEKDWVTCKTEDLKDLVDTFGEPNDILYKFNLFYTNHPKIVSIILSIFSFSLGLVFSLIFFKKYFVANENLNWLVFLDFVIFNFVIFNFCFNRLSICSFLSKTKFTLSD
jgi:hypothetical protein